MDLLGIQKYSTGDVHDSTLGKFFRITTAKFSLKQDIVNFIPLRAIHTWELLGVNYCMNFSVHEITKKSEYTAHYLIFQSRQKLIK